MKGRTALEIERHTLLCSIERCRRIVGLERDVERLKKQLIVVDRQLAASYDNPSTPFSLIDRWSDSFPD